MRLRPEDVWLCLYVCFFSTRVLPCILFFLCQHLRKIVSFFVCVERGEGRASEVKGGGRGADGLDWLLRMGD